jgi:YHS domain-containing protein
MEIAAESDAPLGAGLRWQVYGAPAGEPALGPVAYPHRVSAMPNPLAPIAHHWLDSTHISFGVLTGGIYRKRWKIETSAFNGREPDENRKNFDFGALDSVSGRVSVLPTANLSLQASAGRLKDAEAGDNGGPRVDVNRITASATFHRLRTRNVWASTVGWGRNAEPDHTTNAMLLETVLTIADRDTWFGRFEAVEKTPHDLDLSTTTEVVTVAKLQGGYTRSLPAAHGFKPGLGVTASVGIVPEELRAAYGSRTNAGAGLFLTLRPVAMVMTTASAAASGRTMVMVQTAFDPARLTCAAGFDPTSAANTTYEGKRYYFCSPEDRDKFLTDPKMSLSMMPPKE